MNEDLRNGVIDKADQILSNPTMQKALTASPLASGGAAMFEVTQGWLAIVSLVVGIAAGLLVIKYNYKRNKLIDKELEMKSLEIERLKRGFDDESKD